MELSVTGTKEYLAPQIHNTNSWCHYPLANYSGSYESLDNIDRAVLFLDFGFFRVPSERFPATGVKILLIGSRQANPVTL